MSVSRAKLTIWCALAWLAPAVTLAQGEPNAPSVKEAEQAYEARDYGRCAESFARLAVVGSPRQRKNMLWYVACCRALQGKPDEAFAALGQAFALSPTKPEELKADEDLASLRADPRWPATLRQAKASVEAFERSLSHPALLRELREMVQVDQAAREALLASKDRPAVKQKQLEALDRKNTARMKKLIDKHGWPTWKMVGEEGGSSAWLLVQHADQDLAFQKRCLKLMEAAVVAGQASASDLAYLVDRVALAEGRKQTYGTQFQNGQPREIEDEAHVDERRKAVGLGTLAEYAEDIRKTFGPPPPAADAGQ